jgi:IS30 family transposase
MNESVSLRHETILKAVYAALDGELGANMIALLPIGHYKRRTLLRGVCRRGQIPDIARIDLHLADITERLVQGPWQGNHIKGANNRSSPATGRLVAVQMPMDSLGLIKFTSQAYT